MANGSISNKNSPSRRRFIKAAGIAGLAASVGPWIITRPARAMYQHAPNATSIAPNASAIQPAVIGGRNCWKMTVWGSLQQQSTLLYGGSVQWGERAQWMEDFALTPNADYYRRLAVYVPDDLVLGSNWLLFADLHSRNLPNGVWAAYVVQNPNVLRFILSVETSGSGSGWGEAFRVDVPYTPDTWYDITAHMQLNGSTTSGNLILTVNGTQIEAYYGNILMPDEACLQTPPGLGPYLEYGPYNFSTWPAGVVSQTLYMQAGSLNFGETPNQ